MSSDIEELRSDVKAWMDIAWRRRELIARIMREYGDLIRCPALLADIARELGRKP